MKIVVTQAAYERYCAVSRNADLRLTELASLLQDAYDRGEGGRLDWMGKPALYLHPIYWEIEVSPASRELTLLGVLGMLQTFGSRSA